MKLQMGIVKIEIKIPELVKAVEVFKKNKLEIFNHISEEIKSNVSSVMNQLLQTEMEIFLGQADQTNNKRNGYYEREYVLKGVGCLRLKIPRDRDKKFESSIVPSHERLDPRLKEDLAVLHLAGISNRTLAMISRRILGVEVSASTVQNSMQLLEANALKWLDRKITKKYWALFIDGTNFHIQRRGSTEKEPTLVVLGLDDRNAFSILTLQPGQKDSSQCWESVFDDLIKRGLDPGAVKIGIMDGLPGLEKKFKEYFNFSKTGRCWVHAKRNALNKTPQRLSDAFENLLDKVMHADGESAAREAFKSLQKQMGDDAQRAVQCIEKDLESLLVHFQFDQTLWRTLRTTNPIERVNKELKRRTKVMEGLGEKTLNILLAFVALRLEYNWQTNPVDNKKINNLKNQQLTKNQIEDVLENLIH